MPRISGRAALLVFVAAVAAGGGFAVHQWSRTRAQDPAVIQGLTNLVLTDLSGKPQSLNQWKGKVLVVNFWATWCAPCREEVPALVRAQSKFAANGVQVVGIALDSAVKVQEFAKEFGINYALLIGGLDSIDVTRKLGNKAGGLPYTLVLDREGRVVSTRLGGISDAQLNEAIRPLLGSAT